MKIQAIILFLFFISPTHHFLFSKEIDLENDLNDSFVLETKKVNISGFPYAFNPCIVRWNGQLLMSFRAGKNAEGYSEVQNEEASEESHVAEIQANFQKSEEELITAYECVSPNRICLVWLDEEFNIKDPPQILDLPNYNPTYRQQDPRMLVIGSRLFMVYSDVVPNEKMTNRRLMCLTEIHQSEDHFYVKEIECLDGFEWNNERRWEKNWSPFEYDGNLLFIYSIHPHRILRPYSGTGICETISSTYSPIEWTWGELRGGTPALLVDGQYLSFFHSSIPLTSTQSEGKQMVHYFMGAYTFSASPPFALTGISSKPIVGGNFYNGPAHNTWKPLRVVFPCGFIFDDHFIWVAYGRQDHEIWIAKIDKDRLLKSLIPIHSIE
jgi:predicted GH43/DUF377 family glycosyl hydrolase